MGSVSGVGEQHQSAGEHAELLGLYDRQLRPAEARMFPPGAWVERDGPVERVVGAHTGFVAAPPVIDVPEGDLVALIERQRAFYSGRGEAVEWKTRGHDQPTSIPALLEAAGFVAEETETVLVGLASACAASPIVPAGLQLVPVTTRLGVEQVADMESAIWGQDRSWLVGELAGRVANGSVEMAAAVSTGRPVSAAWIIWVPQTSFAYLAGGGTLPAWRRKGLYRGLVAWRARLALDRGVRYLAVDASEDSRPVLERLGFVALTTTTPYVWTPPST